MPGQKQKKQVAQEPKKITLRERININEDTRIRIMKVSGMVAGVFAVFTFIAEPSVRSPDDGQGG